MTATGNSTGNHLQFDHPPAGFTRNPDQLHATAVAGIRAILTIIGEDPDRAGLIDTPHRVVKAYRELTDRPGDPATLLGTTFTDASPPRGEMIAVGPIEFTSLCEHHLLPFTGHAWIAYVPNDTGEVVGLSKLPRLLDHYAHAPQVQERLTTQVADALDTHLTPHGTAVTIQATHTCMSLRGTKKRDPNMTTSVLRGIMRQDPAARAEFLALTRTTHPAR